MAGKRSTMGPMGRNMTKDKVSLRGVDLKKHDRSQNRKLC